MTKGHIDQVLTEACISGQITFIDCCRMIFEQGAPGRPSVASDQPNYRRDLLAPLNLEFGIQWQDTDELAHDAGAPAIASTLVKHYGNIADPLAGWLEYSPVRGEMEVWTAHRAAMQDATTAMRHYFILFFRDLLLLRWPSAASRTTSWQRLQTLGLTVPVYDSDDF